MKILYLLFIGVGLLAGCKRDTDRDFQASVIVEGTAIKVSAQTGGQILELRCEEGQKVQVGDTLALIDAEKLELQREQVRASMQELVAQQRIARTSVQQARDDLAYARQRYERMEALFAKMSATEQARDDAKIAFDRARAQLESMELNLSVLASREAALVAQIKLLDRQIRDALVIAPQAGTVTELYFERGESVPPLAPLLELIDLSQMWTKVYIVEPMLPKIKIGQTAEIEIDGVEQVLTGTVTWISARAEFTPKNILTEESRTALVYAVKIEIDNPDGLLKHGMPVRVRLQTST